jgi:hypothetical protein
MAVKYTVDQTGKAMPIIIADSPEQAAAEFQKHKEQISGCGCPVKTRQKSIPEFLKEKKPKDHNERVIVLGYYLEKFRETQSFATKDIDEAYNEAKTPKSSNTTAFIRGCISKGWLMPAKKEKGSIGDRYTLTQTGIDYVDAMPHKEGDKHGN